MSKPQGRLGDSSLAPADAHGCLACPHPASGPATSGSPDVLVNGLPALRVGDSGSHAACCGPNTWTAVAGSASVLINGRPAHRQGDQTQHCGGVGTLLVGSANVLVGTQGGGTIPQRATPGSSAPETIPAPPASPIAREAPAAIPTQTRVAPPAAPDPSPAEDPEPPPRTWVLVELRDDDESPVPDEPFVLTAADGSKRQGRTDRSGRCLIEDLPLGPCKVGLSRRQAERWVYAPTAAQRQGPR